MKLIELRKKHKLSQYDLAKLLEVQQPTYNRYETLKSEPDIETLKKLAEYYHTSLDYLCDFNPPYQLTLPPLSEEQKKAVQILLKLPIEIFYYIYAKLESYQEQYKINL